MSPKHSSWTNSAGMWLNAAQRVWFQCTLAEEGVSRGGKNLSIALFNLKSLLFTCSGQADMLSSTASLAEV